MSDEWSIEQTRALRRMTPAQAKEQFDRFGLNSDARALLSRHVGVDLTSVDIEKELHRDETDSPATSPTKWHPPDPDRPLWFASAWLAGASYSILALLNGISPQAVMQSVKRIMPDVKDRHVNRVGYQLSRERVEAMKAVFYENAPMLRKMSPRDVAIYLIESVEEEGLAPEERR